MRGAGPFQGTATVDAVRELLDRALAVYADDPAAAEQLREVRRRLDEPLRVALVGRVKVGKSTLLNALLEERLAPTDAGECTRVVTLYRRGAVPRVVLHPVSGSPRTLPVHRADGALQLDLGGVPADRVAHLDVDWPSPGLAAATLVDTPGISSLSADASGRTSAFLDGGAALPGADAVVFLTRQMQPDDVAFLSSFQAETAAAGVQTTTLTVLSRPTRWAPAGSTRCSRRATSPHAWRAIRRSGRSARRSSQSPGCWPSPAGCSATATTWPCAASPTPIRRT